MRLNDLLKRLPIISCNLLDCDIDEAVQWVAYDSRDVKTSSVFFAFQGERYDSHSDAIDLYKKGVIKFIFAEKFLGADIAHAVTKCGRAALSMAVSIFFGEPLNGYKSAAVTGTNGKTTSAYLIDSIFRAAGFKTVRIGTNGIRVADRNYENINTTPSAYEFFSKLSEGRDLGCSRLSIEVSSHALIQKRLAGVSFDTAVFTNLSGEHLDFHKDMRSYFDAKKILFEDNMSDNKVVNIGSDYGRELASSIKSGLITYCIAGNADIFPVKYDIGVSGIACELSVFGSRVDICSKLTGGYNLENILGAVAAARSLDIGLQDIAKGIEDMGLVEGRLEAINGDGFTVFVDFAHTEAALNNVLCTLKSIKHNRIITVFGAGGDRDTSKRPNMGRIVAKLSDIAIITSDNPRNEDPMKIIADIRSGIIDYGNTATIPDREEAIAEAVSMAKSGDIVLIAGKGHETYQIVGDMKHPFDDRKVAKKYIEAGRVC